ncbi:YraN family protein [Anaeromicropila populeti]|uniref:YraN family protein n=1 Tax=Anaeromicropila populeti TaxID=37658 RepID=UPI000B88C164|nr:YraN family protein [Anaeromicropila populeti]
MYNKRKLGAEQEEAAVKYLEQAGYRIIERNFYTRAGEIDIIGYDEGYLVFIEVKFRSNAAFGFPGEAIDNRKRNSIIKTAEYYIYKNQLSMEQPIRFDAVLILGGSIHLVKNAFQAG